MYGLPWNLLPSLDNQMYKNKTNIFHKYVMLIEHSIWINNLLLYNINLKSNDSTSVIWFWLRIYCSNPDNDLHLHNVNLYLNW